jgi:hypothetical protein
MTSFLSGMTTAGWLVATLFFLRSWRKTRDPLFAAFGFAFLLLAVNQALIGAAASVTEDESWLYLPRLAAFLVIIVGIIRKNVGETAGRGE